MKVEGIKCRALLDTGSGNSYASSGLLELIKRKPIREDYKRIGMMIQSTTKVRDKGRFTNKMYMLITEEEISMKNHEVKKAENENPHELDLWHQRLGRKNENQLLQTIKSSLVKGINFSEKDTLKVMQKVK